MSLAQSNPKISVIVHTFNEERNIRNCLESVKWADEIVIVDMHSKDKTVEIARNYTDRIFFYEQRGYADPARQFGLSQATHEWILAVDADEMVPRKLRDQLVSIACSGQYDAIKVPRRNYFFGSVMTATGWGPLQDMQPRFYRKGLMNYSDQIHFFWKFSPSAHVYHLNDETCALIHFNYVDVEHFLEKMNRYTTIEAKEALARGETFSPRKLLKQVWQEIRGRLIERKGRKDGFQGVALSLFMGMYWLSVALKLHVMEQYGRIEEPHKKILDDYEKIATEEIQNYRKDDY